MLKLALRNIFRQRLRTAMTLGAIVFGVVGLILSGGFVQDVYFKLGEALIHSQSGHLQISAQGFHQQGSRNPETHLLTDPASIRRQFEDWPQIDLVMQRIQFSGLISNGKTDWAIIGDGMEADQETRLGTHLKLIAGRQLSHDDAYGILLGSGVAHKLGLKPGDHITLLLNMAEGALNSQEFEVIGVFQSFSQDYDARAVRIPLAAAQELLDTSGVNSLVIALKDTADTASVAARLRQTLAGQGVEVLDWQTLNDFYASTVALYERQFGVLQLIILMLVLLSVANSVNMSVFERIGEFGTMMAMGNRQRHIFALVVVENLLLGLLGGLLGVVAGSLLSLLISAIGIPMPPPPNANLGYTAHIRLAPHILIIAFGVGFLATTLASLLPARRVARIPVVQALTQNI